MIPNAALIAANLDRLKIEAVLRLKIIAAIVAPLMGEESTKNIPENIPGAPTAPKPNGDARPRSAAKANGGRSPKRARARAKPPKRLLYNGERFRSRAELAARLAPVIQRAIPTTNAALRAANDDPEAVVRRYGAKPPDRPKSQRRPYMLVARRAAERNIAFSKNSLFARRLRSISLSPPLVFAFARFG